MIINEQLRKTAHYPKLQSRRRHMIEGQGPSPPELAQTGLPDKWLRVLSITARAGEVFANRDKALEWLQTPSPALHGATPLRAVETESGCQEVEDILGRIEYGVLG
jgi:putative toxin-antitoxin system antitoxin component (TIGR02293 family)